MSDSQQPFLEVADRIGRRLCRDAVWDGPRCNWLGWALVPHNHGWVPAYKAQGRTLYDGTTGIALFLGWLHHFTGDAMQRTALLGTLRQLKSVLADPDPTVRFGFHAGLCGITAVGLQIGAMLGDEELMDRSLGLLTGLAEDTPEAPHTDVISGSAGCIPMLLQCAAGFGRDDFHAAAVRHGDFLLESARRSDAGWSWDSTGQVDHPHLIGYAHGAGGIACALLELHRADGAEKYRQAALEALRYEAAHYDAEEGNWPDLRDASMLPAQLRTEGPRFALAWCHGAPGVGFSRLAVRRFLPEHEGVAADLDAALAATDANLRSLVGAAAGAAGASPVTVTAGTAAAAPTAMNPLTDFCLCHGAAGNAELLLMAAQDLGRSELLQTVELVAHQGLLRFHETDLPWPCGVLGAGETPNLMLGLAGIGFFYLRLHAPGEVPSVLLISSEAAANDDRPKATGKPKEPAKRSARGKKPTPKKRA